MAFKTYGVSTSDNHSSDKKTVDWQALNEYVVKTCDLEQEEVLVGVITSLIDLGLQSQEDARVEFTGSKEDEAAEIEKHPDSYFEDGWNERNQKVRYKRWPQKPSQAVTFGIDFPSIQLNKGQFFGDESGETKPLRMYLGGQFFTKEAGAIVAKPLRLNVKNIGDDKKKVWSVAKNSLLYKMAAGAKLIADDGSFHPSRVDELLGKSLQFAVRVYWKEGKDGKKYYTESIKLTGGLTRGMSPVEPVTTPFMIQFDEENSEEALSEIRSHVLNTIRMANNFEGSLLQKQLDKVRPVRAKEEHSAEETPVKEEPKPAEKPKKSAPKKVEQFAPDDDFSDIPF